MTRSALVVPVLVLMLSLMLWGVQPRSGAERRINGRVIAAKASYCEPKKSDGCTGTIVLDGQSSLAGPPVAVEVPLRTPISAGCEALSFGDLLGRRVLVTEVDGAHGPIALAISDAEAPARNCG